MPPKKNQKEKDVGWKPHFAYKKPAKENKNNAKCIVHCTDSKEALSSMPSSQFCKRILEAEFWKLPNPWNQKKTSLTSNTITGVEEYIHTVEL